MPHFLRRPLLLILCLLSSALSLQLSAQTRTELREGWTFAIKGGESHAVTVPHTWNTDDAYDDTPGYLRTVGTYTLPLSPYLSATGNAADTTRNTAGAIGNATGTSSSRYSLLFMGSNQLTHVYVNDQLAGSHIGGYTRFIVDIQPYLRFDGNDILRVEVSNEHNPDIPPLSADYTFFGGLYREVCLICEPLQHFAHPYATDGIFLTPKISSAERADLHCSVHLANASAAAPVALSLGLYSPAGLLIAQRDTLVTLPADCRDHVCELSFAVDRPQLWSTACPSLYTVWASISTPSGTTLAEQAATTGFRWFRFTGEGFYLNDEPLKLIGTNRHQCWEGYGWALSREQHVADVRAIAATGSNFLRVSHYPQHPAVMDALDSLGILSSVEVPIVNAITESPAFAENSLEMTREMVMQDYNHPSVILWAYMNEVLLRPPYSAQSEPEKYAHYTASLRQLASQIETQLRTDDPTRSTMLPMHGAYSAYRDAGLTALPDVLGFNLYNGWYGGRISDFGTELDRLHNAEPGRPLFVTEYGADNDARLHSFLPERFDYTAEYAEKFHLAYLADIEARPFVVGATVWNYNDFASEERGNALPHINCKGLVAYDRTPKSTYYFYKTALSPRPQAFISSRHWTKRSGATDANGLCVQPVTVFSNAPRTMLVHDGHALEGTVTGHAFRATATTYSVPFHAGENHLLVVSRDGVLDSATIRFDMPLMRQKKGKSGLAKDGIHLMMGSARYFYDSTTDVCWMPDTIFSTVSSSAGLYVRKQVRSLPSERAGGEVSRIHIVGGSPYRQKTWFGSSPAADANILGTSLDPLYQTAREGISDIHADLPRGTYRVTLHWAELRTSEEQRTLAYNLGNDALPDDFSGRVFSVACNGATVVDHLNLTQQAGYATAYSQSFTVRVGRNEGLHLHFTPHTGSTLLNAIGIERK